MVEVLVAGMILLVAMIGAIHLTLEKNVHTKNQNPVAQMLRDGSRSTVKYTGRTSARHSTVFIVSVEPVTRNAMVCVVF